jgi:hypothetical protein
MELRQRIEDRLRQHFKDVRFALIPLSERPPFGDTACGDENEK